AFRKLGSCDYQPMLYFYLWYREISFWLRLHYASTRWSYAEGNKIEYNTQLYFSRAFTIASTVTKSSADGGLGRSPSGLEDGSSPLKLS
uniref:Uncharacterized protein n=1 Tax=Hippocampus comes TaxID=109280 RepID=A0A3Q2Z6X8_HIPCM